MDAVEEVLRRRDEDNPPPPSVGANTTQQPAITGIARFGKSSRTPAAVSSRAMSPAEKAKELVESYITWCDSDEAPTTATSWGEVMMKWPTVWARSFPEVAQAFR